MIENLAWCRTGIKATKTYRVYSNAFMEGRPQGETGPRNYLRPGIPSIQSGPGAPHSSHVPDRRVSLHTAVVPAMRLKCSGRAQFLGAAPALIAQP